MSFRTASAILRGVWLIEPAYVKAHMPVLVKMMKGESVDFGFEKESEDDKLEKVLSTKSAAVYSVRKFTDLTTLPEGSIAMVSITGPVLKYGDVCSYGMVDYTSIINRLAFAPNVSGVILNMDTPGGEAAGTAMLADAIKSLSSQKPVIAFVDDGMVASAGMWIASAADEIYVSQVTDQSGSVGVYQSIADWYGYFEKEGLKVVDVYAPQSTDKNKGYRDFIDSNGKNDAAIKDELKVLADEFISTVQNNRGSRLTSSDWNTGKLFYADEAQKIGLIDGIKSMSQVAQRMDQLTKQRQSLLKSNNMAFEKTLKAVNAVSFQVVEGGFLLEETHLNSIEGSLSASETKIADLEQQLATVKTEKEEAEAAKAEVDQQLATANTTISTQQSRITELESEDATPGTAGKSKEADSFEQKSDVDPMSMDFQKGLLEKV